MLQQNVSEGKLLAPTAGEDGAADYKIEMVELFKSGNIEKARVLLCGRAKAEEMEDIYRFCYNNISLFGDNDEKQDNAVVIIKQGLVDHALCADAEINLAAVMIKLARNYHA
jgi:hypothetical protein